MVPAGASVMWTRNVAAGGIFQVFGSCAALLRHFCKESRLSPSMCQCSKTKPFRNKHCAGSHVFGSNVVQRFELVMSFKGYLGSYEQMGEDMPFQIL